MSKITAFFALTTLAFGISSIYLYQALQLEREHADAPQGQVATAAMESEVTTAPAFESPSPATIPKLRPSDAGSNADSARKKQGDYREYYAGRLADPAFRAAELAFARLEIEQGYPDLAASLNLQPAEADRLLDLLAEQELEARVISMGTANEDGSYTVENMSMSGQQLLELRQKTEAEQAALLGEVTMQEWKRYRDSLGARAQVRELRTMLAESDYMLRDDQFAPMVAALAAEQQQHQAEREKLYYGSGNPARPTPQEVIEHMDRRQNLIEQSLRRRHEIASRFLDSEQLKHYDEMLGRERKRAQVEYDLFVTMNKEALKEN
jgi:hypothetical protein